jgi:tripartite-type tricarboxylate transporter receptor subunit TctC
MPTLLNWLRAVLVAAALSGGGQIAHAGANFQGKTVTIFIGYGVGGSYDLYAQLFAPSSWQVSARPAGGHCPVESRRRWRSYA